MDSNSNSSTKVCTNCGAELLADSKFCTKCGSKVSPEASSQYDANGSPVSPEENPKKSKTAFVVVSVLVALLLIGVLAVYFFFPCILLGHSWADATCTEAKTCSVCAETEGEALGHTWTDATCTEAKTCSVCAETEGEALGHTWADATCTEAKTCTVCAETEGEALGHTWKKLSNVDVMAETEVIYQVCELCEEQGSADTRKLKTLYKDGYFLFSFEEIVDIVDNNLASIDSDWRLDPQSIDEELVATFDCDNLVCYFMGWDDASDADPALDEPGLSTVCLAIPYSTLNQDSNVLTVWLSMVAAVIPDCEPLDNKVYSITSSAIDYDLYESDGLEFLVLNNDENEFCYLYASVPEI